MSIVSTSSDESMGNHDAPQQSNGSNRSQYTTLSKPIGSGSFGSVFKATRSLDGRLCAIKRCTVPYNRKRCTITFPRELEVLQLLQREEVKGVTPLLDHFFTRCILDGHRGNEAAVCLNMVLPLYTCSLESIVPLPHKFHDYTELQSATGDLFSQLLRALDHIHSPTLRIIHRDIKPQNILLRPSGCYSSGYELHLCDFGAAKILTRLDEPEPITTHVTTVPYRAPEIFFGSQFYGEKADIWAAACVFAEMFTGEILFYPTAHPLRAHQPHEDEDEDVVMGDDTQSQKENTLPEVRSPMPLEFSECREYDVRTIEHILSVLGSPSATEVEQLRLSNQARSLLVTLKHVAGSGVRCCMQDQLTSMCKREQKQTQTRKRDHDRASCAGQRNASLAYDPLPAQRRIADIMPEPALRILCQMLQYSPVTRPSAQTCLSDPYFKQVALWKRKQVDNQRNLEKSKQRAMAMMRGN